MSFIAHETTKITIKDSKIRSLAEAKEIIHACLEQCNRLYEQLGSQDSTPSGIVDYTFVGDLIEFLQDLLKSGSLESMKNKLSYFYKGYFHAKKEAMTL